MRIGRQGSNGFGGLRIAGLVAAAWLGLASLCALAQTSSFHITPAHPTTQDIVFLHGESSMSPFSFVVARSNNSFFLGIAPGTKPTQTSFVLPLGVLPAGKYTLYRGVAELEFVVTEAPAQRTQLNLEGVWSNPQQPGRAIYLVQSDDTLAGGWLVHRANRTPAWYLVQGVWATPERFNGTLIEVKGSALDLKFDPGKAAQTPVGAISIAFANGENGMLTYYLPGATASGTDIPIQRFRFK